MSLQVLNLCSQALRSAEKKLHHDGLPFATHRMLMLIIEATTESVHHSPFLIGDVDRVLLVVVFNLFVQFAGLCGQLVDFTPSGEKHYVGIMSHYWEKLV